jgi:hypothetical protein
VASIDMRFNISDKLGTMLEEVTVDCRNNVGASNELCSFKTSRLHFEYTTVAQNVLQHNFLLLLLYYISV